MLVVTAEQMQAIDRQTIEHFLIPGLILMENAGRGVSDLVMQRYSRQLDTGGALVLIGPGNNGGDGFVIARHLFQAGYRVRMLLLASEKKFQEEALTNFHAAKRLKIPCIQCLESDAIQSVSDFFKTSGVIIDSIFGTGLTREVKGRFAQAIEMANASPSPVVAVDTPSGLCTDTGRPLGTAIRADITATMALTKLGHVLEDGPAFTGELMVVEIGIPSGAVSKAAIQCELFDKDSFQALLGPRPNAGHKGTFGHTLVLAGSRGKTGAAALTARGAMRSGAGLVTLGCPDEVQPVLAGKLTEAMTEGLPATPDGTISSAALPEIEKLADRKQAVAIGPGIGLHTDTQAAVLDIIRKAGVPLVADADALTAIGTDHALVSAAQSPRILTPHPGEMARLLGCSTSRVQEDRIAAARSLAETTKAVVVLKGARTIIADPAGITAINSSGNPGMASGGMGDILTGIIGGLLAQGYSAWDAARIGVYCHGRAADQMARIRGDWGYLASEVADWLPRLWRP